jgi:DNA-binding transcriptional LysR family regulator
MKAQLKIRDLELVVALHEEGTFTQAAKRVGITEPAFSKRLKLVEREVKETLFDRNYDGVTTTDSGRSFVAHILESIHAYYRAVHEAHEAKHGERHKLCIGVSAYLPANLIKLLQSVELALYRDLAIEIHTGLSSDLLADLKQRRIQMALVISPTETPTITTQRISTDPFRIVVRENHPLAARKSVTLVDIAEYPWVFFKRSVHVSLHDLILRRMKEERLQPQIVHQLTHVDQVSALLTNDKIIAWLNPAGAEHMTNRGFVHIPLIDNRIRIETHLATLVSSVSQLESEFVRKFVKRYEEQKPAEQLALPITGVA